MTITRLGTAPRAAGLDYAQFQEHWRSDHASLAGALAGLRGYVQNHAVLRDGRPLLPYAGFDACSEIEFDDLAAMDAAFASEHYRQDVSSDELRLIDKPRFMMALMDRRTLVDGSPPEGAVKLLSFWRAAPRSSDAELRAVLGEGYREAVAGAGAVRHVQLTLIPGSHEGRPPAVCDAVDILTFATPDAALDALRGPAGTQAAWTLGGIGQCVGRLVAREITVV